MGQTSTFQIILIVAFVLILGIAVAVFALGGLGGSGGSITTRLTPVEIWGTFPASVIMSMASETNQKRKDIPPIVYREIDPRFYDKEITEALSTGGGPDLFFVDESILRLHQQQITSITFKTFPERSFKDRYIEGAEIFLFPSATYAIPFGVDPLVMYWNRDLVSAANFTAPPVYWDQLYDYVKGITKRSTDGLDIKRAAVALGDFKNINHSIEIMSTLFFQSGEAITYVTAKDLIKSSLGSRSQELPQAALRFYTEFSNPTSPAYTWNRAMPNSRDAFLGNQLALYFGYASENRFIREANPNLNFDVAMLPQKRDSVRPMTYGRMYGLAISRMSKNKQGALVAAIGLSDPDTNPRYTDAVGLASVRRDILGQEQSDPWKSVAYRSALNSRAWYQPTEYYTTIVFQPMIESVVSGKLDVSRAFQKAVQDLAELFN